MPVDLVLFYIDIYIYIYICVCVCVCERERERESDREGGDMIKGKLIFKIFVGILS